MGVCGGVDCGCGSLTRDGGAVSYIGGCVGYVCRVKCCCVDMSSVRGGWALMGGCLQDVVSYLCLNDPGSCVDASETKHQNTLMFHECCPF